MSVYLNLFGLVSITALLSGALTTILCLCQRESLHSLRFIEV